jgi:hypothetical protein
MVSNVDGMTDTSFYCNMQLKIGPWSGFQYYIYIKYDLNAPSLILRATHYPPSGTRWAAL